jgi:hypothetical protein
MEETIERLGTLHIFGCGTTGLTAAKPKFVAAAGPGIPRKKEEECSSGNGS